MTKILTPIKQRRVSVPVSEEVHAAFKNLASASGMSTGKAMGEWMQDTLDAVEFMASKMQQARAAPRIVAREMHAYALGLQDETGALMRSLAEKGAKDRAAAKSVALAERDTDDRYPPTPMQSVNPPSCNTGGKVPGKGSDQRKTKGGKAS